MKIDVPAMKMVNAGDIVLAMKRLHDFLKDTATTPTVGASACLMLFAAMLKASGHPEQEGHNALDRMFETLRILDTDKPS